MTNIGIYVGLHAGPTIIAGTAINPPTSFMHEISAHWGARVCHVQSLSLQTNTFL